MYKKTFLSMIIVAGVVFFPFCLNAQLGKETKLLRQIRVAGDSGISSIPKMSLQQLTNVPAQGSQYLILMGSPGIKQQAFILWLAKSRNKEAYRVDLNEVISKYIGETEKNLDHIFQDSRAGDNVLFFDNGDALFGKRTNVKDSHDKYANQEAAYLLNRIENYQGLVVLSTNNNTKIDSAYLRKFRFIIKTD